MGYGPKPKTNATRVLEETDAIRHQWKTIRNARCEAVRGGEDPESLELIWNRALTKSSAQVDCSGPVLGKSDFEL